MKPQVPVFQNLQAPASSSSSTSSDPSPSSASRFDFDRGDQTYLNNIELDASRIIKSSSAASTAGFSHSVRINYSLSRSNLQLLNSKLKLILSVLLIHSGIDSDKDYISPPANPAFYLHAGDVVSFSPITETAGPNSQRQVRFDVCESRVLTH